MAPIVIPKKLNETTIKLLFAKETGVQVIPYYQPFINPRAMSPLLDCSPLREPDFSSTSAYAGAALSRGVNNQFLLTAAHRKAGEMFGNRTLGAKELEPFLTLFGRLNREKLEHAHTHNFASFWHTAVGPENDMDSLKFDPIGFSRGAYLVETGTLFFQDIRVFGDAAQPLETMAALVISALNFASQVHAHVFKTGGEHIHSKLLGGDFPVRDPSYLKLIGGDVSQCEPSMAAAEFHIPLTTGMIAAELRIPIGPRDPDFERLIAIQQMLGGGILTIDGLQPLNYRRPKVDGLDSSKRFLYVRPYSGEMAIPIFSAFGMVTEILNYRVAAHDNYPEHIHASVYTECDGVFGLTKHRNRPFDLVPMTRETLPELMERRMRLG